MFFNIISVIYYTDGCCYWVCLRLRHEDTAHKHSLEEEKKEKEMLKYKLDHLREEELEKKARDIHTMQMENEDLRRKIAAFERERVSRDQNIQEMKKKIQHLEEKRLDLEERLVHIVSWGKLQVFTCRVISL